MPLVIIVLDFCLTEIYCLAVMLGSAHFFCLNFADSLS